MTYIVPDDWYANHNLAPGDARLPQKPMQPVASFSASEGLAPTPPMRGYFGPRPNVRLAPTSLTTQSPWSVTDVMWGMHGLGTVPVRIVRQPGHGVRQVERRVASDIIAASLLSGLGDAALPPTDLQMEQAYRRADEVVAAAQVKIRHEMQAAAATNTSIAIGLACIPVVGWVIGPLYGIVTGISNAHYKNEAAKVMANLTNELNELGAAYQVRLQQVLDAVFDDQKPGAIALAVSNTPLNGLGALGFSYGKDIADRLFNPAVQVKMVLQIAAAPVHLAAVAVARVAPPSVARAITRADNATYGDAMRMANKLVTVSHAMTGEDVLDRTRAAADEARAKFKAVMDQMYATTAANAQSPQYRSALTLVIAKQLRDSPAIGSLVTSNVSAQSATPSQLEAAQQVVTDVKNPAYTVLPAVAAAGAVLLMLGLKR